MPAWRRGSSDRSYRSSSPSSPATPLSPTSLPQWLRPGRGSGGIMPPGRFKILFIALVCMMLGWSVTTVFTNDLQQLETGPYDSTYASTGILDDPAGFGADPPTRPHDEMPLPSNSIKDALGNLHKAVSDKISGWRGHTSTYDVRPSNVTAHVDHVNIDTKPKGNGSFSTTKEAITEALNEDERLGARTRIGKCTILFNGNDLWERAIRSHEAHDKMHGYRLHVLRQHLLDDVWSKPAYILSLMLRELAKPEAERLEWLFWVDADTILLNPHIPIEAFLPPHGPEFSHIHLLYSNDWNGLNNGVFPIRVNKWSVELLSAIVAFRHYRPDQTLVFRDQSAMDMVMNEPKFAKGIIQLPQRWFNAYQGEHNETLAPHQIRRGDLLVHFAGVGNRDERMAFWLDRAESHLDDWEVPYKMTSYPEEIKDFWAQQRRAQEGRKAQIAELKTAAQGFQKKVELMKQEFGDRIEKERLEELEKQHTRLTEFLGNGDNENNLEGLRNVTNALEQVLGPLETVQKEGHTKLLKTAHDAVFSAEKELLAVGFYDGVSSPEALETDAALKRVKELILTSEETWNRQLIVTAVDALTSAHGKLQAKRIELEQAATRAKAAAELEIQQAKQAQDAAMPVNSALGHPLVNAGEGAAAGQSQPNGETVYQPSDLNYEAGVGRVEGQTAQDSAPGAGQMEGQGNAAGDYSQSQSAPDAAGVPQQGAVEGSG